MKERLVCLNLREDRPRLMPPPERAALCLGNFDGVHRAHTSLLREGIRLATELTANGRGEGGGHDVLCGVFCFFKPSIDHLPGRGERPLHLTSLREKLRLLAEAGMDFAYLCPFPDVRDMSPEAFISLLRARCGCVGVACGFNFRFGYRAEGTASLLASAFGEGRTVILPAMELDGDVVSATRIRACLLRGDVEAAERLLGRPYALETTVTHGKQLGRSIGFPTANQYFLAESIIPAHGVYAVLCHTPAGVFPGVANVGNHPTVDTDARVNCETYIIGYNGDLYGHRMRVELLTFLRPEQKFADLPALTAAIRRDAERAEAYVQNRFSTTQFI